MDPKLLELLMRIMGGRTGQSSSQGRFEKPSGRSVFGNRGGNSARSLGDKGSSFDPFMSALQALQNQQLEMNQRFSSFGGGGEINFNFPPGFDIFGTGGGTGNSTANTDGDVNIFGTGGGTINDPLHSVRDNGNSRGEKIDSFGDRGRIFPDEFKFSGGRR